VLFGVGGHKTQLKAVVGRCRLWSVVVGCGRSLSVERLGGATVGAQTAPTHMACPSKGAQALSELDSYLVPAFLLQIYVELSQGLCTNGLGAALSLPIRRGEPFDRCYWLLKWGACPVVPTS